MRIGAASVRTALISAATRAARAGGGKCQAHDNDASNVATKSVVTSPTSAAEAAPILVLACACWAVVSTWDWS